MLHPTRRKANMAIVNAERAKSDDYSKGFSEVTLDVDAELLFTKRLREEPGPRHVRLRRNAAGLLTMPPHITTTPEDGMRQPWTGNDNVDRNLFAMDRAVEIRQSGGRALAKAQVGRTPAGDLSAAARAGKGVKVVRDRRKVGLAQPIENQLAVEGEKESLAHDHQIEASKDRREQKQAAWEVRKTVRQIGESTTADGVDELRAQVRRVAGAP